MKILGEKPTAAFALSLVGAIFMILGGLVSAILASIAGGFLSIVPGMEWLGGALLIFGILGLIFGILVLVGAVMINSGERDKVRTGSIIVLIFSILNLIFGSGGFFIGFILGLIGGILGLIWKPGARAEAPPPPPPT
ncbi:MAG: hypothetical protein QXK47_02120 [Candidatus Bathyarchaeia archaeon]